MPHHARLTICLIDLHDRALERARILSGHTPTAPNSQPLLLRELDDEITRLASAILGIAQDAQRTDEERTLLYALVSLLQLTASTPFTARVERVVNTRFRAGRARLNALRRERRRQQRQQSTGSAPAAGPAPETRGNPDTPASPCHEEAPPAG